MKIWSTLERKAVVYLRLHEQRSTFVPLVRVLVEDGGVVLLWIFAAFNEHGKEGSELGECVIGIADVRGGL